MCSLFWIQWLEPLALQLRAVESEQSHDEHQHQKTSQCDNCQLLSCFSCPLSYHWSIAPTTCWFKSMHTSYLLSFSMLMNLMQNGLLEVRSNFCSWLKMKTATVVPLWPDINLHCISSISTLCLIFLSNMHSNTLINCLINFKPLFRAPPLPMFILSISLCTNIWDYAAD